jgi:membrane-associated phospholipid phosphatase
MSDVQTSRSPRRRSPSAYARLTAFVGSRFILPLFVLMCIIAVVLAFTVDRSMMSWLWDHRAQIEPIPKRLTDFGMAHWYLWPSGVLGLVLVVCAWVRHRRGRNVLGLLLAANRSFYFFTAVALAGLGVQPFKLAIGRPRPTHFLNGGQFELIPFVGGWSNASMPSGHAAVCGGVCGALIVLWPRLTWVWLIPTGLLALTRVLVRSHYLGDVLVGYVLGIIIALLVRKIPIFRGSDRLTARSELPATTPLG